MLREANARIAAAGYCIGNIDATIIAQAPKLAPYIGAIVETISRDLGLLASQVNVKAKTAERLGTLGREEGIAAEVVVLLFKSNV